MDQPDLEGSPEHPPGDDAYLWIVPVALRSDRRFLDDGQSGSDANDRIGLAIRC